MESNRRDTQGSETMRVGLICSASHPVFSDVAAALEQADVTVTFFEPGRNLGDTDLADLSLLANKTARPESLRALSRARTLGVPTWNGYRTLRLAIRPLGYLALTAAGFRVPELTDEKPDGEYVAKTLADWSGAPDPVINGEGDLYQRLVPAVPIDYKYYAVDTGPTVEVCVLETTSKLYGSKRRLTRSFPNPAVARKMRRLLTLSESQALGVDCIESVDGCWAVDVNPAPSFRGVGMNAELVASMLAQLDRNSGSPGRTGDRRRQPVAPTER